MLYPIGDFASRTGLTPRALRLYDQLGLLPARRDPTNEHRYYTDDDVSPARRIGLLRGAGFSLRDIADLLAVLGDPIEVSAIVPAFRARLVALEQARADSERQEQTLRQLLSVLGAAEDANVELSRLAEVDPKHRRQMMQTLHRQSATLSARGPRPRNEDHTWVQHTETGGLFVVADGMGGHERGGEASVRATEVVLDLLDTERLGPDRWARHLGEVVASANAAVHALGGEDRYPGTTLAVLVLHDAVAFLTSVGDTRIYRMHNDALVQLTRDHSVVQRRCDAGELSPHELHAHPDRHLLTSGVGSQETVAEIFLHREEIPAGARYLLVSDGVTRALTDDRIAEVLRSEPDARAAVASLIALAEADTDDNASAIVVDTR